MTNKEILDTFIKELKDGSQSSNYNITGDIAEGGMGKVYFAEDKPIGRKVALKILHDNLQKEDDACIQFIEEARITGLLEHSNIVPVHTIDVNEKEQLYFTMKFVDGDSLLTIVDQLKNENSEYIKYYSQFMLLRVFRKVCDAVSYAHSKGIVHRDIKPENIMIGDYGEVQLMDWGIAKFIDDIESRSMKTSESNNALETQEGVIKGSPAYMSPEQARGEIEAFDTRSDIFLLGATLYHMMTLSPPYYEKEVSEMVRKAETCDFPPPSEKAPDRQIPDELSEIILKAMHPEKDKRYQRVSDLTKAIDELMSGQIMSTKKTYNIGEDIIKHGDTGNEAYVIIEGEVEVYKQFAGKKTVFTRLHAGDVFGEMAAITDTLRSASIVAIKETTCLVITPETLTEQLKKMPPWLEKIVTALSNRLRSMDNLAHPMLISDCTFEVCNQLKLIMMCYGAINSKNHLEHNLSDVIYEISNNLKIPEERVRPVLAGLVEINLADIDDYLNISIPNWHLFSDFVEFCKDAPRLSTTSTRNISTIDIHKVYTDGESVIHRHSRLAPNQKMPPLKTMKPLKDAISGEESTEYKKGFRTKLRELMDYAAKSESLNQSMFNNRISRQVFNPSEAPKISTKFKIK
ncbi:MAG: protein kinase [Lentisphaeraceae bacterium]|nr:protein kinase [Lentisphaeraceae bacterium]